MYLGKVWIFNKFQENYTELIKMSSIRASTPQTTRINKFKQTSKVCLILVGSLLLLISDRLLQSVSGEQLNSFDQEASNPQTLDIISTRGFKGEAYEIRSKDGTPLVIYHIINPLADPNTLIKYPMLMGHGLGGDSAHMFGNTEKSRPRKPILGQFTIQEGDECFAVALLNNNFDVWIYDSRGTNRNNHKVVADLDPFVGRVYFNYSIDEQILFDIPTFINFTLVQTQSTKLFYTGYSESTTMILALMSARPDVQEKFMGVILMAPVCYLTHLRGLINFLLPFYYLPDNIAGSILPEQVNDIVGTGGRRICGIKLAVNEILCQYLARILSGAGETEFSPAYFSSFIKGTSAKAFKHFTQLHVENRFGMFNYGSPQGNLAAYGQTTPPDYNIANIKLPTLILARGGNDFLASPEDQEKLLANLGTKPFMDIYLPTYNHLDLQLSTRVKEDVQLPILTAMFKILETDARVTGLSYIRFKKSERLEKPFFEVFPTKEISVSPVQKKTNILTDIVVGLGQEDLVKVNPLLSSQVKSITGIVRKVDALTDEINKLPDQILDNPVLKPITSLLSLTSIGKGTLG